MRTITDPRCASSYRTLAQFAIIFINAVNITLLVFTHIPMTDVFYHYCIPVSGGKNITGILNFQMICLAMFCRK